MNEIKPINFIVVELCDNDFGHDLRAALRELMDTAGGIDFCPNVAKDYIVEYMLSAYKKKIILRGQNGYSSVERIEKWFSRIRVTFRDKLPTYDLEGEYPIDHDSGSAYYDVNLDEVFAL